MISSNEDSPFHQFASALTYTNHFSIILIVIELNYFNRLDKGEY